jgi:GntR family transcriptional repressor for pyruvate dehydrogenase complex
LRQALKVLEIMGVISQRVGDGTYLNPAAATVLGEPDGILILLNGISFHELMEARVIVEPELAARAAGSRDRRDLAVAPPRNGRMEAEREEEDAREPARSSISSGYFQRRGESRLLDDVHRGPSNRLHRLMELTSRLVRSSTLLHLHSRIYTAIRRADADEAREADGGTHSRRQRPARPAPTTSNRARICRAAFWPFRTSRC